MPWSIRLARFAALACLTPAPLAFLLLALMLVLTRTSPVVRPLQITAGQAYSTAVSLPGGGPLTAARVRVFHRTAGTVVVDGEPMQIEDAAERRVRLSLGQEETLEAGALEIVIEADDADETAVRYPGLGALTLNLTGETKAYEKGLLIAAQDSARLDAVTAASRAVAALNASVEAVTAAEFVRYLYAQLQGASTVNVPGAVLLSQYVTATGLGVDNTANLQAAVLAAEGSTLYLDVPGVIAVSDSIYIKSRTTLEWRTPSCVITARDDFRVTLLNNPAGPRQSIFVNWRSRWHNERTLTYDLAALHGQLGHGDYDPAAVAAEVAANAALPVPVVPFHPPSYRPVKMGYYDWFLAGRPVTSGTPDSGTPDDPGTYYGDADIVFINPRINGRRAALRATRSPAELAHAGGSAGEQFMHGILFDSVERGYVLGGEIVDPCGDGVEWAGSSDYQWANFRRRPSSDGRSRDVTVRGCGRVGFAQTQLSGYHSVGCTVLDYEFCAQDFEPDWMGDGAVWGDVVVESFRAINCVGSAYHPGNYGLVFSIGSSVSEGEALVSYPRGTYRNITVDGVPFRYIPAQNSGPGEENEGLTEPAYGVGVLCGCAPRGFEVSGYRISGCQGAAIHVSHGRGVLVGPGEIVHNGTVRPYYYQPASDPDGVPTIAYPEQPAAILIKGEHPSVPWLARVTSCVVQEPVIRLKLGGTNVGGGIGIFVYGTTDDVRIVRPYIVLENTLPDAVGVSCWTSRTLIEGARVLVAPSVIATAPATKLAHAIRLRSACSHVRVVKPLISHATYGVRIEDGVLNTRVEGMGTQASTVTNAYVDNNDAGPDIASNVNVDAYTF